MAVPSLSKSCFVIKAPGIKFGYTATRWQRALLKICSVQIYPMWGILGGGGESEVPRHCGVQRLRE